MNYYPPVPEKKKQKNGNANLSGGTIVDVGLVPVMCEPDQVWMVIK
jgi:hypothetical protein